MPMVLENLEKLGKPYLGILNYSRKAEYRNKEMLDKIKTF